MKSTQPVVYRYKFKLRVLKQNKFYEITVIIGLIQCYDISKDKFSSLSSLALVHKE